MKLASFMSLARGGPPRSVPLGRPCNEAPEWGPEPFRQLGDVHLAVHLPKTQRSPGPSRCVGARRSSRRFGLSIGNEVDVKKLPKYGIRPARAVADHHGQSLVELLLVWGPALQPAAQEAAQKDQGGHPLGVLGGVADGKRAALRNAQKGEPVQPAVSATIAMSLTIAASEMS